MKNSRFLHVAIWVFIVISVHSCIKEEVTPAIASSPNTTPPTVPNTGVYDKAPDTTCTRRNPQAIVYNNTQSPITFQVMMAGEVGSPVVGMYKETWSTKFDRYKGSQIITITRNNVVYRDTIYMYNCYNYSISFSDANVLEILAKNMDEPTTSGSGGGSSGGSHGHWHWDD